ncbi:MAG: Uma2 family endonuclease [Pirellulaceae bacterium]|nr:Uma2 family endonuclease [Pirellulaceae bacterium]
MSTEQLNLAQSVVLHMGPLLERLSDDDFYDFCQRNRELRIESTRDGDLVIMPPTGGETGHRNALVTAQLVNWSLADGTGLAFDSSTGFRLLNGAKRSPDCAWVARKRWDELSAVQRAQFPPLAPDFVLEIRSSSDPLADLLAKMAEYIETGVRLGWLLDPDAKQAWVYRPGAEPLALDGPAELDGGDVLPGFKLQLAPLWG